MSSTRASSNPKLTVSAYRVSELCFRERWEQNSTPVVRERLQTRVGLKQLLDFCRGAADIGTP